MDVNFYRAFAYLLLALHFASYLFFHMMIRRCEFQTVKLKKDTLRRSLPLNLGVNTLLILFCLAAAFPNREALRIFRNIFAASFSYEDIAKLGVSAFACVFISMLSAMLCCVYFRSSNARMDTSPKQKSLWLSVSVFALIPLIAAFYIGGNGGNALRITDVCRRYETRVLDEKTQEDLPEDYSSITLRNTGAIQYGADCVYLSLERDDLRQVPLKALSLSSGEERTFDFPANDSLLIKKDGTSVLYLSDEWGNILDQVSVPTLEEGAHYRKTGTEWHVIAPAAEEPPVIVPAPVFSAESGFYDEPFELTVSAEPGTTVYYTLDCGDPDENALRYTSPIPIYDKSNEPNVLLSTKELAGDYLETEQSHKPVLKCTVIRAAAVDAEGHFSDVVTGSYFIGKDIANFLKGMPVLSVVSSPNGLIGPNGIMVTGPDYDEWYRHAFQNAEPGTTIDKTGAPVANFNQHGMDWERKADIQFFSDGKAVHQQMAGIRVQGNASRKQDLKRFSIYARKAYCGSAYFPTTFVNSSIQHSLLIKNGTTSAFCQRLCADRDVLTIDCKPMVLFVNGEYFYNGYLYEKFDEKNISKKYGLTDANILIRKNGESNFNADTDMTLLKDIRFIEQNDMSIAEYYAALNSIIDVQSYIDWVCINGYLSNMDLTEFDHNSMQFRSLMKEDESFGDTRWRWGLIDMDMICYAPSNMEDGILKDEPWRLDVFHTYRFVPINQFKLYSFLKASPVFCRQFVLTFMDLVNTTFAPSNAEALLNSMGIATQLYHDFFANRPAYAVEDLAEEFGLTGSPETVALSSNRVGAPITLNTVTPELKNLQWSGSYFTDYPVTVTAAEDGFDHWEITADGRTEIRTEPSIEVPVVKGGVQIHAVYQR